MASASPRRRTLLEQIGVPYRVRPAEVSETRVAGEGPEDYVRRMARAKADAVWDRIAAERSAAGGSPPEHDGGSAAVSAAPVLAADTAVVVDGEVFGKPRDEADALAMLGRLSGRSHRVLTALALRHSLGCEERLAASEVRFRATTAAERRAYCRSGEPFGKAGGYAIQALGAVFVEHLEGSFSAVMGLPLYETAELLDRFGLPVWLAARTARSKPG